MRCVIEIELHRWLYEKYVIVNVVNMAYIYLIYNNDNNHNNEQ